MVATYSQSIWSDSNVASAMAVTVRKMVAKAPPLELQHSKSFGHFRSVSPDSDKKGENVAIWICIICQEPNEEAVSPRMCSFCGTSRTMLERKSSMIRRLDKEAEEERKRQRDRKAHDARLRARFKHLGLREHVCGDDGNCMFRAISHQLYRTEDHHDKLRAAIVKYISNTPNDFAIYFESDQEFHSYCNELSRPGVWGDELTLGAASRCLGVEVHVITSNEERWFLTYRGTQCGSYGSPSSKEEDTPTAQIFLAYHSPVHYNSVIPEQFEPSLSIGKHVKKPETSTKTSSNGPHASIVIDEASPSSPLSRASSIYLHRAPSNSFMPTLYLGRQEPVLVHVRTQVPKYYLSTVGGTLLGATKDVTTATAFYLYVSRVSEEDFDVIDALNMRSTTSANGSPRSTSLTSSPNEILLHVSLQDARTGYFVKRLRSSSSPSSPKGPMERSDVTINLTNGDPLHALTTLLWNCKTGRLEFRVAPTSQPQYIHVSGPERKVYIVQSSKTPHDPFSTCSTESRTPSISQFVMEYVVKNDPHAKFCMFCGFIGSWGKEKGNNVCPRSPQRTHASLAV